MVRLPRTIRANIGKKFPNIIIKENVILTGIKRWFSPGIGWHVRFKLYIKFDEFELNFIKCIYYKDSENTLKWRFNDSSNIEKNLLFYQTILNVLKNIEWEEWLGTCKLLKKYQMPKLSQVKL